MKLPYRIDLSDKVVVVTGGGGILMAEFGRALAACGAKVALLDINEKAAQEVAESIGENAIGIGTNCLVKESIIAARDIIHEKWGKVNFLINGAGGNNPRASSDNEYMTPDLEGCKTFFDLEESGLKFVFDLNSILWLRWPCSIGATYSWNGGLGQPLRAFEEIYQTNIDRNHVGFVFNVSF